jgi:hypothetical protein
MELRKLMKFLHNNFRRLNEIEEASEKYLRKLTKLEVFTGEGSFKSSTAETISKSEVMLQTSCVNSSLMNKKLF